MTLSPNGMALLDACAKAITFDEPSNLNLFDLKHERSLDLNVDVPVYLAKRVEALSSGRYTVRDADAALFAMHAMGPNLYLARCSAATQPGTVTELTSDMFLISLGPYSNGFTLHAQQASPERVAEYRAYVAKNNAERAEREAAEATADDQIDKIKGKLQLFVNECDDEELRARLANQLKNMKYGDPKLKDILAMCHYLNVDFAVVVEALA